MAVPLSAAAFLAALKAEGCAVVEYKSWRTHNRNHKGAWGPVNGVMIHHTVSSGEDSSVALCYNGHASLPGPLCHTVGGKSGKLYLVSAGRANHAGSGDGDVLNAVINESALPADNQANTDGNRHFYGIEIVNLGNGTDQYPAVQYDAAVRWAAALCRAHGWGAGSVIGHREWQPGKIDPHGPVEGRGDFSMSAFRADVAERLKHPASWSAGTTTPSPAKPSSEETDVPKYVSLGMTKPLTLQPNTWKTIAFNEEWRDDLAQHYDGGQTFATGAHYNGVLQVTVDGLERGNELQVRLVEDSIAEGRTVKAFPPTEVVGTSGGTYSFVPAVGVVGKDRRVKFQVAHYSDSPITLTRAELKAHLWAL